MLDTDTNVTKVCTCIRGQGVVHFELSCIFTYLRFMILCSDSFLDK